MPIRRKRKENQVCEYDAWKIPRAGQQARGIQIIVSSTPKKEGILEKNAAI